MHWFEVEAGFPRSHKVGRLARALGIHRHQAMGMVVSLWAWCAASREGGGLDGLTAEDLADACGWDHLDASEVLRAMVSTGWIDETPEGMQVHEWLDHQGKSIRAREHNAKRQERFRRAHSRHITVTEPLRNRYVTGDQTRPDRPDQTDQTDIVCPEPQGDSGPAPSESAVLLRFPIVGSNGSKVWEFREAFAEQLNEAFPDLVIDDEARKALAWIQANPERRKTARGMPRFLTGWMSRTQNRHGGVKR